MGVTWIPTEEILAVGEKGATEHVCRRLVRWSAKLSTAIANHTKDEETQEATRRSGGSTGQSGLTEEEKRDRDYKSWHRKNFEYVQSLYQEIKNWKGARKGYGKGHGKGAKSTKGKRSFDEMSNEERGWLEQLWNGNLHQMKEEAAAKCRRIQANPFTIRG